MQQETFLPIGTVIRDRYVVEDLLGKGEGDLVYLVRDRWSAQNLFILKERINPDKQARDRFLVEGVVLKQLRHPALQRVYRVFEENAGYRVYMLMQYIPGQDLETMHRQWPNRSFSLPLTLSLMTPIVEAVTYLHSRHAPVIHRDINPSNIIVTRNKRTVLVNFGILECHPVGTAPCACPLEGSGSVDRGDNTTETPASSFLFSPGYGAPEQYGGESNPSTDLYALAATFYTLLTGLVPPDAQKRIAQVAYRGVDPLMRADVVTSAVPGPIAEAIHRAMSIRSDERFSSVTEFWQALHGLPDSRSIKQALLAIADAETLELQAISGPSPEQEPSESSVGADLSSPTPIDRLPIEDVEESKEELQQEVPASPIGASAQHSGARFNPSSSPPQRSTAERVSIFRPSANLLPIQLHLYNRIIALRPHLHLDRLRENSAKFAGRLAIPSGLHKPLSLPRDFIRLHNHVFTQRSKKPAAFLLLVLVLALFLGVGTMLWPRTKASHNARPATATSIVVHEATPTPTKPIPTKPTPTTSPKAGSIYTGTMHDLLANTSTRISLTGMELRLGNISGYLRIDNGVRGSGPFEGTFNAAQQHIQFIVLDSAGHPIYSFEGGLHPDGNIAGSYCALNQSGQCSGHYGLWSASPNGLTFSLASRSVL